LGQSQAPAPLCYVPPVRSPYIAGL